MLEVGESSHCSVLDSTLSTASHRGLYACLVPVLGPACRAMVHIPHELRQVTGSGSSIAACLDWSVQFGSCSTPSTVFTWLHASCVPGISSGTSSRMQNTCHAGLEEDFHSLFAVRQEKAVTSCRVVSALQELLTQPQEQTEGWWLRPLMLCKASSCWAVKKLRQQYLWANSLQLLERSLKLG